MEQPIYEQAKAIFQAGVEAANPKQAVLRALDQIPVPKPKGRLILVAMGKASNAMARAALERLAPSETLIITHNQTETPVSGATAIQGGHPLPDENSLAAAVAIESALARAQPDDQVLALISGGASALVCAPLDGVSLADKVQLNHILLGAGLDIGAMNLVRQNLSRLKGGGFLRVAAPAHVTALILSDVIGNDLRVVASGPTVSRLGGPIKAREVLVQADVWDHIPASVQNALGKDVLISTPVPTATNHLIGSNEQSVMAMSLAAPEALAHPEPLIGDVADAARIVIAKGPGLHLFGGETTVRLTGAGLGGRNQELALRVAILAEQACWPSGWVFLSGGTDGRDGPTDAAGGLVDGGTLSRIRATGIDPIAALSNNDSYHALKAASDLLITGATGTNVADLQVLIRP